MNDHLKLEVQDKCPCPLVHRFGLLDISGAVLAFAIMSFVQESKGFLSPFISLHVVNDFRHDVFYIWRSVTLNKGHRTWPDTPR